MVLSSLASPPSGRTALNTQGKEGKGVEERPASVLSSLSYRKRLTLKDSIGGTGDEDSLFTTLSERAASPERPPRKARGGPREEPSQGRKSSEPDECGSVFSGVGGRASRGLEKRWGSDFDRASTVSAPVSRASSATRRGSGEDGTRSSMSFSLSGSPSSRRSSSRLDSLSRTLSPSLSRASALGRESPDSRLSLGQSCLDDWDDGASVALSEAHSQYSHPSLARSLSVPPQPRVSASAKNEPLGSSIRPVSRQSYLDPDLEAAINEVLSYKPVPFHRRSLEPDSEDDDRKSIQSTRSAQLDLPERSTNIRRSASAADVSRSHSSRKSRSKRRSSSSSSSSSEDSSEHRWRKKGRSRKSKKKSKSRRKRTETESESSSSTSSGSTASGHSRSSVKKGPAAENEEAGQVHRPSRKEEKKRKKEVDSLMMRYLYRPESD